MRRLTLVLVAIMFTMAIPVASLATETGTVNFTIKGTNNTPLMGNGWVIVYQRLHGDLVFKAFQEVTDGQDQVSFSLPAGSYLVDIGAENYFYQDNWEKKPVINVSAGEAVKATLRLKPFLFFFYDVHVNSSTVFGGSINVSAKVYNQLGYDSGIVVWPTVSYSDYSNTISPTSANFDLTEPIVLTGDSVLFSVPLPYSLWIPYREYGIWINAGTDRWNAVCQATFVGTCTVGDVR